MLKKVYSLYSAFCTRPAFYSQSAVCILHSVCILPLVAVCSLQSAVCVLHLPVTLTGDYSLVQNFLMAIHSRNFTPKLTILFLPVFVVVLTDLLKMTTS